MKPLKSISNPLIAGTLLLTVTGLSSRVIGFFYRIFLSRIIGAEGLGIYQLIFPVFALCIAFSSSGIQTAVSRFVAAADHKNTGMSYLYAGLVLSVGIALSLTVILISYSDFIAIHILDEARCAPLLVILSYCLIPASVHACINGYYYGKKKTLVPSVSQLMEQVVRVLSVYTLYLICLEKSYPITPSIAVWGVVCGELASSLFSVSCLHFQKCSRHIKRIFKELSLFARPLTTNHVAYHLFSSIEAILIPICLKKYGYSNQDALSVFGIFTGMAMPMILFPNVLVNSVSVLLMPAISEAYARKDFHLIRRTIKKTVFYCLLLGFSCTFGFLLTGKWIGQFVFQNTLAGSFILILSWICPFLYLSTTLTSVLHGLGKPGRAFYINMSGCTLRIFFIYALIPTYGIRCYLYGMLAGELLTTFLSFLALLRFARKKSPENSLL